MAIWPFGRRNKRRTIAETPVPESVAGSRPMVDAPLVRKPSRKQSKRRKERHSQPPENIGGHAFHDPVGHPATSSRPSQAYPHHGAASSSQQASRYPPPLYTGPFDAPRACPNAAAEQHAPAVSRTGSLLRRKPSDSGATLLRRKSSKRKANDIAREREIRLMSSSPIEIPRNSFRPATGEQFSVETARGPHAVSRQSDRQWSGLSMSIRNSAASSMTDVSDSYTFKVNALAAWTPRPVLRYVGSPRPPTWTSRNESAASDRRDRWPVVPSISEDDLYSKKRVEELADDLDAGALRELLERDRRRKERKRAEDQEQLQRKLQRRAERQRNEESRERQPHGVAHSEERRVDETGDHAVAEDRDHSLTASDEPRTTDRTAELRNPSQRGAPGSWLRDPSKERERERDHRESLDSVRVIGNIDDSSIRAAKRVTQRSSLALSQDTVSSTRSPAPGGFGSPNSSQIYYGLTPGSTSDVSRTFDSERRLSDHSSRRTGTLSSFFRRGSSRLKRSYRERFQADQASDRSNTSHESFFKVQTTHAPGPAAPSYAGSKTFLRPGTTIQRPQSKFKEHFGDEVPISPPDSRLQSPDIPETIPDQVTPTDRYDDDNRHGRGYFHGNGDVTVSDTAAQHHDTSRPDDRHRSWGSDSYEGGGPDPNPLPLSQSLASVDSEGSWMSGKFLRRISQGTPATTHHLYPRLRHSIGSIGDRLEEEQEYSRDVEDVAGDDYFARFTPSREDEDVDASESHAGTRRPSSTAIGELISNGNGNGINKAPGLSEPPTEAAIANAFEAAARHGAVGKRPTVVTPGDRDRRQSNVAHLNHIDLVSPVSVSTTGADSSQSSPSPVDDEEPAAVGRARSVDFGRGGGHARQISAGSARLLDIHRRSSTSKPEPDDDHYVAPGTAF